MQFVLKNKLLKKSNNFPILIIVLLDKIKIGKGIGPAAKEFELPDEEVKLTDEGVELTDEEIKLGNELVELLDEEIKLGNKLVELGNKGIE